MIRLASVIVKNKKMHFLAYTVYIDFLKVSPNSVNGDKRK